LIPQGAAALEKSTTDAPQADWTSDLDLLAQVIRDKHINPFTKCNREKFDGAVAQVRRRLPTLQDHQILVEFLKLTAMLGDGHTTIQPGKGGRVFRILPVLPVWTQEGLFIAASTTEYQDLLRCRIVGIGSTTLDEAVRRVEALSGGNESARKDATRRWLMQAEVLHALGLTDTPNDVRMEVECPENGRREVLLRPLPANAKEPWVYAYNAGGKELSVSRRPSRDLYGLAWLADSNTLYCWYDSCEDLPNRPVSAWCKEVLAEADRRQVERLVVDLRRNGGGSSRLAQPLIRGLATRPALNRKGKVFVLIGPGTYSSAVLNALDFRSWTKAILVGQPSGGSPNEFGEIKFVALPHSRWLVQYSTRYFKLGKEGETTVKPDVEAPWTAAAYFAGRDPALEAALKFKAGEVGPDAAHSLAAESKDGAAKRDLQQLQGEWRMQSLERNGKKLDDRLVRTYRRTVTDKKHIVTWAEQGVPLKLSTTLTLDPTQNPKAVDVLITDGPLNGKTRLGIYRIDGDIETVCLAQPGKPRPTSFDSKQGAIHVWKRVKK
jgi:uncharacterized protein (TIGR03067 family)